MRKKVSWLRMLQDIDEAMNRNNLSEYEVPVEQVRLAQIDGGYPTLKSQEDVAEKFNLQLDFGPGMIDGAAPPPIRPMCKVRRIK